MFSNNLQEAYIVICPRPKLLSLSKIRQHHPIHNDKHLTYSVLLVALEPPGATLGDDGVLPQGLSLLPHQVIITSDWNIMTCGDMIKHRPKVKKSLI